ncbi:hypothetical protein LEL84_03320 [Gordonia sp. WA4-43]|nr:hypothetical protein [Gordonia sp. WA4-43]UCZ90731.1 hypothetical protein LEL84_03320 [Gordonia sp. WA4-43]
MGDLVHDPGDHGRRVSHVVVGIRDVVRVLREHRVQPPHHLGDRPDETCLEVCEARERGSPDVAGGHARLIERGRHRRRHIRGVAQFGLDARGRRVAVVAADFEDSLGLGLVSGPGVGSGMGGRGVASIVLVVVEFVVVDVGLGDPFVPFALALFPDAHGLGGFLLRKGNDAGPTCECCSGFGCGVAGGEPWWNLAADRIGKLLCAVARPVVHRNGAQALAGGDEVPGETRELLSERGDSGRITKNQLPGVFGLVQILFVGHGAQRVGDVVTEVFDVGGDAVEADGAQTAAEELRGAVDESADDLLAAFEGVEQPHLLRLRRAGWFALGGAR